MGIGKFGTKFCCLGGFTCAVGGVVARYSMQCGRRPVACFTVAQRSVSSGTKLAVALVV